MIDSFLYFSVSSDDDAAKGLFDTSCTTDFLDVSSFSFLSAFIIFLTCLFFLKIPYGTTAAIAAITTPQAQNPATERQHRYCGRILALTNTIATATICSKYLYLHNFFNIHGCPSIHPIHTGRNDSDFDQIEDIYSISQTNKV